MPELPHQTIRLSAGHHSSPNAGMCVVELASVLAGEPFSDRPQSVCPVIAAFLRTYNDRADADRRQDLIPYAAKIVGSVVDLECERERAAQCVDWAAGRLPVPLSRRHWRLRRIAAGRGARLQAERELAASWAARSVATQNADDHVAVLGLLDRLLSIGKPLGTVPDAPPTDVALGAPSV
jgi:hypothetical protein